MSTKKNVATAYESGLFSQKEIADKAGVSQSYVSNAIQEKKKDDYIEHLEDREKQLEKELEYTKIDRNNYAVQLQTFTTMSGYSDLQKKPMLSDNSIIDIDDDDY